MRKEDTLVTKSYLKEYFKKSFDKSFSEVFSRMLKVFVLKTDFDELKERVARLEDKMDAGFSNLDRYLKRTESWHDEQVLLRASHQRLKDTLVKKGVVSDAELAV